MTIFYYFWFKFFLVFVVLEHSYVQPSVKEKYDEQPIWVVMNLCWVVLTHC